MKNLKRILAAALVLLWRGLPRTYDGQAEARYADSGGAYQLVLAGTGGGEPVREVRQDAEAGVDYRYPVCLYIRRADSGAAGRTAPQIRDADAGARPGGFSERGIRLCLVRRAVFHPGRRK